MPAGSAIEDRGILPRTQLIRARGPGRAAVAGTHDVRKLGVFNGVKVLEFVPRSRAAVSQ
jgi:hypothetical protein